MESHPNLIWGFLEKRHLGGAGGAFPPVNLKNSEFFVFLHTIFFILYFATT